MKNILNFVSTIAVLLILVSCCTADPKRPVAPAHVLTTAAITNFDECVQAGNRILKSLPAQCVTRDGQKFFDSKTFPREKVVNNGTATCKDLCGDGVCQEMVCMAVGCPCAETAQSCPKDCH